jgi:hypothetical protein
MQIQPSRLSQCEVVIEKGMNTFVEVGLALLEIRDDRLYKEQYSTFEEYLERRWGMSRSYAHRLIDAAQVASNLLPIGNKPISESQIRSLTHLEPEEQREAWDAATNDNPHPTAKAVQKAANAIKESRADRIARHRRRAELNGTQEVLAALDNDEIAPATAETIANQPKEYQAAKLEQAKIAYAKKKAKKPASVKPVPSEPTDVADTKTGKVAPPEERVPEVLMRQILTPDLVGKGFRTCSDVKGDPCQLSPNVSEMELKERAAFSIAGDETFKSRKAHAKWDQYEARQIRAKLIKVLKLMSPMHIPAAHRAKALNYIYNLEVASDLRELAEMISADLLRAADTLELQEKYGHIHWPLT